MICDEFPAVTEPYFRSKNGFSFASASIVCASRTPLSSVATLSNAGGSGTGTISSASFSRAACARWCERRANASCISRVSPPSLARSSAVSPMFRPQTGSVRPSFRPMTGFRSWLHGIFRNAPTFAPVVRAIPIWVRTAFTSSR